MPKPKTAKLTLAELQAIKDYLITQGFRLSELDNLLGTSAGNRTHEQIALEVTAHLKKSKKKPSK